MSTFRKPDAAHDKAAISGRIDWKEKFWRPAPGENLIRILPAKDNAPAGVTYHLKVTKHFFNFGPKSWEVFVCNQEMYNLPCPVCERRIELFKSKDKELIEQAKELRSSSSGIFNIVDRSDPKGPTKLYEAPYSVWFKLIQLASGGGRFSDLILSIGPNGEILGRDIALIYHPSASPQYKYEIIPDQLSPLGSEEDVERWMGEIIDLTPETFWKPIDYDEATFRAFGTDEDRKMLREARESSKAEATNTEKSEAAEEGEEVAEEPPFKPAAVKPEPVKTEPVKPAAVKPSPVNVPARTVPAKNSIINQPPNPTPVKTSPEPVKPAAVAGTDLSRMIAQKVADMKARAGK
jgi:hypothetical protein